MLSSRSFIVIICNDDNAIAEAKNIIKGFKAITIIKTVNYASLKNIQHFNKSAVYFTDRLESELLDYSPIVIQLTFGISNVEKMLLSVKNIERDFPMLLATKGIDCGDHISSTTDTGYVQPECDCLFCNIYRKTASHPEHILYETDNFFVLPGTGAFFDGYIMIVPKKHIMSFANLEPEKLEEFFMIYDSLSSIIKNIYNKGVFGFECGSGKTGAGKHKSSIVHCHFHMAATNMPVLEQVQESGLNPQLIYRNDLLKFDVDPYMLYVDQKQNWYLASDKRDYYPRQHPRQVLAHWMYQNDFETLQRNLSSVTSTMDNDQLLDFWKHEKFYNWRNYPLRKRLSEIAMEFRTFFKEKSTMLLPFDRDAIKLND